MRRSLAKVLPWPTASPVLIAAIGVWALLLGMLMLMVGNGLQGTLIGIRATGEGFSTNTIGIVMAGYFAGFLAGSKFAPDLMRRAGHLRVFAALGALASVAILFHSLVVTPVAWLLLRLVTGFAFAGIYIVAESWLNDRVTNEHRGGLLAIYMVVSYAGLTGGQLLLNLADPALHDLFMVVAILISLASVPILLTAASLPAIGRWENLGPYRLYKVCHLGAIGAAAAGLVGGVLLAMGPVYATAIGLTVAEVSVFMALLMAAGALAQYPIGKLSDRFDRRRVIVWVGAVGTLAATIAATSSLLYAQPPVLLLIVAGMAVGGSGLALYPLFSAHTNDFLEPDQRVGAGSSLIMLFGSGAVVGPLLAGQAMGRLGAAGFFWLLCAAMGLLTLYTLWRIYRLGPLDIARQSRWVLTPLRTAALVPAWIRDQTSRVAARHEDLAESGGGSRPAARHE